MFKLLPYQSVKYFSFLRTFRNFFRFEIQLKRNRFYASYSWASNSLWIYAWEDTMMDELSVNRGFSPHFSPSRNLSNSENQQQQLYIHLPNHGFRMIRIDEAADVRSIVSNLVGSMSSPIGVKPNCHYYALRLRHIISKEILWLPSSKSFYLSLFINFLLISLQLLFLAKF